MSRKKKKKPPPEVTPAPRVQAFSVGDKVRVKHGVADPDFKDIPLGGWCGSIQEVDTEADPPVFLVNWNQPTLNQMHPVYRKRCERDDLDPECMWLESKDLEPDDGTPTTIEQPTDLITRPLNSQDQDDRIRAIFQLTSDDPLPLVSMETLKQYHQYLSSQLTVPFPARFSEEIGPFENRSVPITVLSLLPLEETTEEDGLLCEVRMEDDRSVLMLDEVEVLENSPQGRLMQDYTYWFINHPADGAGLPYPSNQDTLEGEERSSNVSFWNLVHRCGLLGAAYGATIGPIAAVIENATMWMAIGAVVLGLLFGLAGRRYGVMVGNVNRARSGSVFGSLLGLLLGAAVGALLGALTRTFVGSVSGSILGVVLGGMFLSAKKQDTGKIWGGVIGACLGGIGYAFYEASEAGKEHEATMGLLVGAVVGAAGLVLFVLVFLLSVAFLMSRRR